MYNYMAFFYFIRCHSTLICRKQSNKTIEDNEGTSKEEKRMQRLKSKRKNNVSAYKV